jgi:DNA-binding NarL/FixJ family response regulator
MRGHNHSDSYVLIGDSPSKGSMSVREIFRSISFHEIEVRRNASSLRDHLNTAEFNLLVYEVDLRDGDTCGMVNSLRQGDIGLNPFVPVLGLTSNAMRENVRRVVKCVVDGLVAMPANVDRFATVVASLINKRKPFVVTVDYVGPDRRYDD